MEQFIRVRLIQCNSLDLHLFQFDYDLTFAAFFLNADRTIYGRFGTRSSQKEASRDISITGFRRALEKALTLHQAYPANQTALAGKTGSPPSFKIPQEFPSLTGKYTPFLDYEGQVARSCIHCHMLGEAARKVARNQPGAMPDPVLYPWPMPNVLGLVFDPDQCATLKAVLPGSVADKNDFRAGDEVLELDGQPLLSIADVQWILHQAKAPQLLRALIQRGNERISTQLPLRTGWRRSSDLSWRTTSWDLRRIATGGLLLESLAPDQIQALNLPAQAVGLRVEHVGQYGNHAVAKRAGFKKNDIITRFDGLTGPLTESDIFAHILRERRPGEVVDVTVHRQGKLQNLKLKIQ